MATRRGEWPPILRPDPDPSWRNDALCRGAPDHVFFPHDWQGVSEARAICALCPVTEACLDYAIRAGEHYGVWGGKSERERRTIARQRRRLRGVA